MENFKLIGNPDLCVSEETRIALNLLIGALSNDGVKVEVTGWVLPCAREIKDQYTRLI